MKLLNALLIIPMLAVITFAQKPSVDEDAIKQRQNEYRIRVINKHLTDPSISVENLSYDEIYAIHNLYQEVNFDLEEKLNIQEIAEKAQIDAQKKLRPEFISKLKALGLTDEQAKKFSKPFAKVGGVTPEQAKAINAIQNEFLTKANTAIHTATESLRIQIDGTFTEALKRMLENTKK